MRIPKSNFFRLSFLLFVAIAILASMPSAAPSFPTGSFESEGYTVTFQKTGAFRYLKGNALMVDGTYVIKQDEITMTDKTGADACVGADRNPGTYRWTFKDDALSFTTVHDPCDARVLGLTKQHWKRKR